MSRFLSAVAGAFAVALIFVASASAAQTATIGSTSGTPNGNLCPGPMPCTFVPFNNVSSPGLVVPFDGTVTSFSLNAASAGGTVKLRVLRQGSSAFAGVGTSPAHTLAIGLNTFGVSLPVKKGDVLGLDNDSNALMFETPSSPAITAYYNPPLADGSTRTPTTNQNGYRLLLSAVVQASPPKVSNARLTHKRFRAAKGKTVPSAKAPRGTSFKFTLSNAADVQIAIARLVPGLRKGGRCVKPTQKLRSAHAKHCTRRVAVGKLTRPNLPQGDDTVKFTGRIGRKVLKPARYAATLSATSTAGASKPVAVRFRVVRQ